MSSTLDEAGTYVMIEAEVNRQPGKEARGKATAMRGIGSTDIGSASGVRRTVTEVSALHTLV